MTSDSPTGSSIVLACTSASTVEDFTAKVNITGLMSRSFSTISSFKWNAPRAGLIAPTLTGENAIHRHRLPFSSPLLLDPSLDPPPSGSGQIKARAYS